MESVICRTIARSVATILLTLTLLANSSEAASAKSEDVPDRIDTFPSPDGSVFIDVNSTGGFFASSEIFARFKGETETHRITSLPFPLQGAPVWADDNRLMVLHTGTLSAGTSPTLYERHGHTYEEKAEADPETILDGAEKAGINSDVSVNHLYLRAIEINEAKEIITIIATGDGISRDRSKEFQPFSIEWHYKIGTFDFSPNLPKIIPPTSAIRMAGETYLLSGTGFVIAPDGYIATCAHLLDKAYHADVRMNGQSYNADLVSIDKKRDVAILRVKTPTDLPWLPLGDSDSVDLGDEVSTLGFPNPKVQGFSPKFTKGEISATSGFGDDPNTFQVSVPFQSGNSGGPLVNSRGEVVGILSSKLDPIAARARIDDFVQNVNYAVKINVLRQMAKDARMKLPSGQAKDATQSVIKTVSRAVVRITTYGLPH